jgi:hypothetical protein
MTPTLRSRSDSSRSLLRRIHTLFLYMLLLFATDIALITSRTLDRRISTCDRVLDVRALIVTDRRDDLAPCEVMRTPDELRGDLRDDACDRREIGESVRDLHRKVQQERTSTQRARFHHRQRYTASRDSHTIAVHCTMHAAALMSDLACRMLRRRAQRMRLRSQTAAAEEVTARQIQRQMHAPEAQRAQQVGVERLDEKVARIGRIH